MKSQEFLEGLVSKANILFPVPAMNYFDPFLGSRLGQIIQPALLE